MSIQRLLPVAFLILITAPFTEAEPARSRRSDDRARQIQTMARMRQIHDYIVLYREDHGSDPASLEILARKYSAGREAAVDGWRRPFFYYTTGDGYVLASFGRSGIPTPQVSRPGEVAPPGSSEDFEVDFVLINGEWAQSPYGVDR